MLEAVAVKVSMKAHSFLSTDVIGDAGCFVLARLLTSYLGCDFIVVVFSFFTFIWV